MNLVPDWRRVLRHAWSIHLNIVAALLLAVQIAEPFLPVVKSLAPEPYASVITLIVNIAAIIARLVKQRSVSHGKRQD